MLKSEMFDKGKVFCQRSIGLCFSLCFSERYENVVTEQATVKEVRDQLMIILLCSQYDNIYTNHLTLCTAFSKISLLHNLMYSVCVRFLYNIS